MSKYRMIDIHIDALAYAAGVVSPANLPVSHAPAVRHRPRQRLRRLARSLLTRLAAVSQRWADRLGPADTRSADLRSCCP